MEKKRADILLVEAGLVSTRSKAKLMIKNGSVLWGSSRVKKAGELVTLEGLSVTEEFKYVGRGGFKLEAALEYFKVSLNGAVVADIGASTGGFTDCCLKKGASRVYAIDVGHGQLDPSLISNPSVINLEGCNVRELSKLDEQVDYCVADLSYISLRLVLKNMFLFLKDEGRCITLFKPQFEVGKDNINKTGVVKSASLHREVLINFYDWSLSNGINVEDIIRSPITGKQGNLEFLLLLSEVSDSAMSREMFSNKIEELIC